MFVGIDIGKTKLAVGLVTRTGEIQSKLELPSDLIQTRHAIIGRVTKLVTQILAVTPECPEGIGVATTGVVEPEVGLIISSGSIPDWRNIPIKDMLEDKFAIATRVENDVNAAALGEYTFGAGRGCNTIVFLTVSTGVGVGIILNGSLWRGRHGVAGAIAHVPLFAEGLEVNDIISGTGLSQHASRALGYPLSTKEVFELAREHRVAQQIIDTSVDGTARVVAWLQNTIDPDLLILGGGVALGQPLFLQNVKRKAKSYLTKYSTQLPEGPQIVAPALGHDASLVGAAVLCMFGTLHNP